jgi:hypothetical protein
MVRECYGGYRRHKTALGTTICTTNLYTTCAKLVEGFLKFNRALIRGELS